MATKSPEAKARRREREHEYNRTHRELRNFYLRDWCKRNPERRFMRYLRYRLKSKYGLTVEQYRELVKKQNGLCAICGRPFIIPNESNRIRNGQSVVVDHKGKKVRGLLHNDCNRALGLFGDNVDTLIAAVEYLLDRE